MWFSFNHLDTTPSFLGIRLTRPIHYHIPNRKDQLTSIRRDSMHNFHHPLTSTSRFITWSSKSQQVTNATRTLPWLAAPSQFLRRYLQCCTGLTGSLRLWGAAVPSRPSRYLDARRRTHDTPEHTWEGKNAKEKRKTGAYLHTLP